ncbi:MAG: DUF5658 family protein [Chromatiales bacterium]|jgi:hypothetical protein
MQARKDLERERQLGWLGWVVAATIALNVLDAAFTLFWVHAGLARETNPLMRWLVNEHPVAFTLSKLTLVGLGTLLLWRARSRALAVIGIVAVFLVYYAILIHHLRASSTLVLRMLGA